MKVWSSTGFELVNCATWKRPKLVDLYSNILLWNLSELAMHFVVKIFIALVLVSKRETDFGKCSIFKKLYCQERLNCTYFEIARHAMYIVINAKTN